MLELILIRHAKSAAAEHGLADFDRTLNARGEEDAVRAGQRLAELRLRPDLVVCSSAPRARETAQLVARQVGYPEVDIREIGAFYDADADTLLEEVQRIDPACRRVALVAHNPGISVLSRLLTGESVDMPTCAFAVIRFDVDDWRAVHIDSGRVTRYESPAVWAASG